MKSEIWDLDKGRKIAEADGIVRVSIYGNNQLYLFVETDKQTTEYIVLMPGWQVKLIP